MSRTYLLFIALLAGCKQDYAIGEVRNEIAVSPDLTDLGAVAVGGTYRFQLQIDTVSGADVPLVAASVTNIGDDYFSLVTETLPTVPEDAPAFLDLEYTPSTAGFHRAAVTIVSESKEPEIVVQVRAQAAEAHASIYPSIVDFGPVTEGDDATASVTLVNDGFVPVDLAAASFTDARFTLSSGAPATLTAGDTTSLVVRFGATSPDAAEATMSLDLGPVAVPAVTLRANDCLHGSAAAYDADHDGYATCAGDCDDTDAGIFPGVAETCDGLDQDCDGVPDEGTECFDDDGDGATELDGDCNDGDDEVASIFDEILDNGVDDDCDGNVDDGVPDDGDGYTTAAGDCDDTDPSIYPGAPETADGDDDDCDGRIDEGTTAYDDDGDGMTEAAGDCDDADKSVYTGARETADWTDEDCDGSVDEGTNNYDDDGDGYTETGGDCNDTSASVSPAVLEKSGNGVDDDCDGVTS